MAFERTKKLFNALIRLDETKIINAILSDKNFQKFIISLNQNDQLFDLGIDSLGVSLGEYSDFTKVQKQSDGQRFDHITLLDTGGFYKSFTITVSGGGFIMENLQIVIDAIRERILTKIREQIKLVA